MRTAGILLIVILTVIAGGCTTTAPQAATTPAPTIPSLVGTWSGPSAGYDEGVGFSDYHDLDIRMVVTEQKDRVFAGRILFVANGTESATEFAGVIGREGRTFAMSEQAGGYCFGEILGPDAIEITYLEDGSPYSASIDSFTRVK
ncbi:MAG: hypothetical protein M0Q92_02420 [Methanoregula sp.]|jgi:hypothetical protein|nr:hypothetical protein [Methanoregula sp.]